MKADPAVPATSYSLNAETWAQVVEEYLDGASARAVAAKWKTSAGSVYRWVRILKPGAGKRATGDARARAHARMVEEEEAATRALNPVGSRALKGLFAPQREGEAVDPLDLEQMATLASGRAMAGRLWSEARALAGLAESYARLVDRQRARVREDTPPEDPTEPGRRQAVATLKARGVTHMMYDTDADTFQFLKGPNPEDVLDEDHPDAGDHPDHDGSVRRAFLDPG